MEKNYLLESFELDVTKVRFIRVDAVWPEIFMTKFGAFGWARIGRPASPERRRGW